MQAALVAKVGETSPPPHPLHIGAAAAGPEIVEIVHCFHFRWVRVHGIVMKYHLVAVPTAAAAVVAAAVRTVAADVGQGLPPHPAAAPL